MSKNKKKKLKKKEKQKQKMLELTQQQIQVNYSIFRKRFLMIGLVFKGCGKTKTKFIKFIEST